MPKIYSINKDGFYDPDNKNSIKEAFKSPLWKKGDPEEDKYLYNPKTETLKEPIEYNKETELLFFVENNWIRKPKPGTQPSKYHTWVDRKWIISKENQTKLVCEEQERAAKEEKEKDIAKYEDLIFNRTRQYFVHILKIEGKLPEDYT